MPSVRVNGQLRELPAHATVADAVAASGAAQDARGLAAALDGEVVPRGEWERTRVRDGQRIEVLQAVQGG
jgi:sulfur carrier protein